MFRPNFAIISIPVILTGSPATAQFSGAYAPGTWTITGAGIGGSSATFSPDGSSLAIVGSDGAMASSIDATHVVLGTGEASFDWSYLGLDGTPGLDSGYYLHNGTAFLLSDTISIPYSGTVTISVEAGDIIGWRVHTIDGLYGPGKLTISDFQAPVPVPAALALLGLAAMPRPPRRRCC